VRRPGPLLLEPVLLPKVWAADRLPRPWRDDFDAPPGIGEIWLASARGHVTKVARGEHAGMGLDQVIARWPEWVLGQADGGELPILVKLLSVGQWLSVQVHPDDQAARRLENEPWGKSEAWHVLAAEAGAEIIHGLAVGVDAAAVAKAVAGGRLPEVLARVPAKAGDTFHLPAGTVHATGPGLLILEIQQASDVTYRFYDWDRLGDDGRPRTLHQERALEVMRPSGPGRPAPRRALPAEGAERELLVSDEHFALARCRVRRAWLVERRPAVVRVLYVAQGRGRLSVPGGPWEEQELSPGQSWLIPAGLGRCQVSGGPEGLTLFECAAAPPAQDNPATRGD